MSALLRVSLVTLLQSLSDCLHPIVVSIVLFPVLWAPYEEPCTVPGMEWVPAGWKHTLLCSLGIVGSSSPDVPHAAHCAEEGVASAGPVPGSGAQWKGPRDVSFSV